MKKYEQVTRLCALGINYLKDIKSITEVLVYSQDGCRLLTLEGQVIKREQLVDNDLSRSSYSLIVDAAMRVHNQTAQDAIDWLTGYDLILFAPQTELMAWPTSSEDDHDHSWSVWSTKVKRI